MVGDSPGSMCFVIFYPFFAQVQLRKTGNCSDMIENC